MKTIVRFSLAALAIVLFANSAIAQLPSVPVYTGPAGYQGLMISGDWGMGMNDDAKYPGGDSPMTFGGAIGYGAKMFNINGLVGYVDPKVTGVAKPISFGGNVGVTVLHKADQPLAINVFGGAAFTSFSAEGGGGIEKTINVPFGVGVGFTPASSGNMKFTIWGAPRGDWVQTTPEGGTSDSQFGFGASGGVTLNFAQGFGVHAAIDWSTFSIDQGGGTSVTVSPMVVGAGVHYNFKNLGGGQ
jgi:hypothetical protein